MATEIKKAVEIEKMVNVRHFYDREVLLNDSRFLEECVVRIGNIFELAGNEDPETFYRRVVEGARLSTRSTNRLLLPDKPEADVALQHVTNLLLGQSALQESVLSRKLSEEDKLKERYGTYRQLLKANANAHYEKFKREGSLTNELNEITSRFETQLVSAGPMQHTLYTIHRVDTNEATELYNNLRSVRRHREVGTYHKAHEVTTVLVRGVGEIELRIKEDKGFKTAIEKEVRRASSNGGYLNHHEPHDLQGYKLISADAKYHTDWQVQAAKVDFRAMVKGMYGDRVRVEEDNVSQDISHGRVDWERDRLVFTDKSVGRNPYTGEEEFAFLEVMYHGALDEVNNACSTADMQSHFLYEAKRRTSAAALDYPDDVFGYGIEDRAAEMLVITERNLRDYKGVFVETHISLNEAEMEQFGGFVDGPDVIVSEPLSNAIEEFRILYQIQNAPEQALESIPTHIAGVPIVNGRPQTIEELFGIDQVCVTS